ncbi:MAG: hypothetical protein GY820_38100 [Gammaproteobacteria bacterium]|nr:hypothetical protein [Gammaproteobacteria bacterium]
MVDFIQGPIPGQSLTDTPRNAPWERPAEIDTVEDTVKYYVNKLADPDVMDDLVMTFQLGADLKTVSETIVTMGSMKGMHTVETGMLAGPVVASFIKVAMDSMGVDTPETPVSFEERSTAKEKQRLKTLFEAAVEKGLKEGSPDDPGVAFLQEAVDTMDGEPQDEPMMDEAPVEEPQQEEQEALPVAPQGAGLMARRGTV